MSPATCQERVRQGEVQSSDGLALKFTHRSDIASWWSLENAMACGQLDRGGGGRGFDEGAA